MFFPPVSTWRNFPGARTRAAPLRDWMSVDLVSSEEASTHSAPSFSCSTQEAEVPHKLTAEQLPGEKKNKTENQQSGIQTSTLWVKHLR